MKTSKHRDKLRGFPAGRLVRARRVFIPSCARLRSRYRFYFVARADGFRLEHLLYTLVSAYTRVAIALPILSQVTIDEQGTSRRRARSTDRTRAVFRAGKYSACFRSNTQLALLRFSAKFVRPDSRSTRIYSTLLASFIVKRTADLCCANIAGAVTVKYYV